ncbi:hypothetical protein AA0Y32_00625 [Georgenia phoenicis]|uniref:hypothetical protein n=1 Tax=unclassified Georgenia TaxID=2626815 RepID=UPI0039B0D6A9
MLGVGKAGDRQAVRGKRTYRAPAGADSPGQSALSWSWSRCWAFFTVLLARTDGQVLTSLPGVAVNRAGGGGRQSRHLLTQYSAVALVNLPGDLAISDRVDGARPAKATAQASTA